MSYDNMESVRVNGRIMHVFWDEDDDITDAEVREAAIRAASAGAYSVRIRVDEGDLLLEHRLAPAPFERIRRITGYLVGTTARFNDAKLSEVNDRVSHKI